MRQMVGGPVGTQPGTPGDRGSGPWVVAVLILPLPTQVRLVIFPFQKSGPLVHLWAGKACRGAACCGGPESSLHGVLGFG